MLIYIATLIRGKKITLEAESSDTIEDENANGRIVMSVCEKQPGQSNRHSPEKSQCNILYTGSYLVEYLFLFVKGMERSSIIIHLTEGNPLILHYPMGTNSDYIRYILAARNCESTEVE